MIKNYKIKILFLFENMECTTIKELRTELHSIEALYDDFEMRKRWTQLKLSQSIRDELASRFESLDPHCEEYKEQVLAMQQELTGNTYSTEHEGMRNVDIEQAISRPFPFITENTSLIGGFLIGYGHLIKLIGDTASSVSKTPIRVLEVGSGRGALSYFLAKSGFDLTCLDVNPQFIEICKNLTATTGNTATTHISTMEDFQTEQEFDIVLFFESFHHSLHHAELLEKYKNMLSESGAIIFAAEPIVANSNKDVPYPWGLRLCGEALRGIVVHGWMELGFSYNYFNELLSRNGLSMSEHSASNSTWGHAIVSKPTTSNRPIPKLFLKNSLKNKLHRLLNAISKRL